MAAEAETVGNDGKQVVMAGNSGKWMVMAVICWNGW
jgi:hypothetical protein